MKKLIHTDNNGVNVEAELHGNDGTDVEGHDYLISTASGIGDIAIIKFQNGPVQENGVNGMTSEALLAILVHRTNYLNGEFPCRENSIAITKMEEALHWLEARTKDRIGRGVEGYNSV